MKRKTIAAAAMLLIALSWGGNVWYYDSMQLGKPLFLNHNIAVHGVGGEQLVISYLENIRDAGEVTGIRIEELPAVRFELRENTRYSHQALMRAYAHWERDMPGNPEPSQLPLTIDEITVHYKDRPPEQVPIGEIVLMGENRAGVVDTVMAGGSSDGTGKYTVRLTQKATLERVDHAFSDRLGSGFRLELDGSPVAESSFPRELEAGDTLAFSYAWLPDVNEQVVLEEYDTKLLLYFRLEDGSTAVDTIPISRNVYLSEAQVKRLVRSANGGDA